MYLKCFLARKKKKNPVIQKERIKPKKKPVFLLVNSFYEKGHSLVDVACFPLITHECLRIYGGKNKQTKNSP